MRAKLDILLRTAGTVISFTLFGLGALLLSLLAFPLIHLCVHPKPAAQRTCRRLVQLSFRLFIELMKRMGVLDYDIFGTRNFGAGQLIVANHPSLIDVIFVVAQIPDAYCIVKEALRRNPFTGLIVGATGYVANSAADQLIADCVTLLDAGGTLIMFPEGTRTRPGQSLMRSNRAYPPSWRNLSVRSCPCF